MLCTHKNKIKTIHVTFYLLFLFNFFKVWSLTFSDHRFVAGAGASEVEVAKRLRKYADSVSGLERYAVQKFANALEVLPKTIAENSGMKVKEVMDRIHQAHFKEDDSGINVGINIEVSVKN